MDINFTVFTTYKGLLNVDRDDLISLFHKDFPEYEGVTDDKLYDWILDKFYYDGTEDDSKAIQFIKDNCGYGLKPLEKETTLDLE